MGRSGLSRSEGPELTAHRPDTRAFVAGLGPGVRSRLTGDDIQKQLHGLRVAAIPPPQPADLGAGIRQAGVAGAQLVAQPLKFVGPVYELDFEACRAAHGGVSGRLELPGLHDDFGHAPSRLRRGGRIVNDVNDTGRTPLPGRGLHRPTHRTIADPSRMSTPHMPREIKAAPSRL